MGKKKKTYEVCEHYFSKDNFFQSQVTKISNQKTNVFHPNLTEILIFGNNTVKLNKKSYQKNKVST